MFYDGLSARAKGWLLAKHHFATLSIFQELVKGSAPTSLLPTTLHSSFPPPLLLESQRPEHPASPNTKGCFLLHQIEITANHCHNFLQACL